jgi:hypothetical protein
VAGAGGSGAHQAIGQPLRYVGGEETRVRIGDAVDLLVHRAQHVRVRVPQAGDCRTAGRVQVAAPFPVGDPQTLRRHGHRRQVMQVAVENMGAAVGHGTSWSRSLSTAGLDVRYR